jgi:hypothetical protein
MISTATGRFWGYFPKTIRDHHVVISSAPDSSPTLDDVRSVIEAAEQRASIDPGGHSPGSTESKKPTVPRRD